ERSAAVGATDERLTRLRTPAQRERALPQHADVRDEVAGAVVTRAGRGLIRGLAKRHAITVDATGDLHPRRLREAELLVAAEETLVGGHERDDAIVVALDARALLREVPLFLLDAHVALIVGRSEDPIPDTARVGRAHGELPRRTGVPHRMM